MIDFVANHVGPNHPWLNDADKNDWFNKRTADTHDAEVRQRVLDNLPELKTENPDVKSYLLDVARWWVEETNIDGYRLVKMQDVGTDFWKDFVSSCKNRTCSFLLDWR